MGEEESCISWCGQPSAGEYSTCSPLFSRFLCIRVAMSLSQLPLVCSSGTIMAISRPPWNALLLPV